MRRNVEWHITSPLISKFALCFAVQFSLIFLKETVLNNYKGENNTVGGGRMERISFVFALFLNEFLEILTSEPLFGKEDIL